MNGIQRDTAKLFGTFLQLSIWGLYSGLFFVTLWTMYSRGRSPIRVPVVSAIVCIYALNVLSTVSNVVDTYRAFVLYSAGSLRYYLDLQGVIFNTIGNFVMITSTILADGILAWRLFIIWGRNPRLLILPITALVFGVVGGTAVFVYDVLICINGRLPVYERPYNIWTIALYAITVLYNWLITGLIIWRLRWADPGYRVNSFGPEASTYTKIIIALVEAGSLYSVTLIGFVVAFVCSPRGFSQVLAPSMPHIVGIVPVLICLQRTLGYIQPSEFNSFGSIADVLSSSRGGTTMVGSVDAREKEEYEMIKLQWLADPEASTTDLDREGSTGGPGNRGVIVPRPPKAVKREAIYLRDAVFY